jgi:hypothetical protein
LRTYGWETTEKLRTTDFTGKNLITSKSESFRNSSNSVLSVVLRASVVPSARNHNATSDFWLKGNEPEMDAEFSQWIDAASAARSAIEAPGFSEPLKH